jgi:thioredoxin-related protein
MMYPSALFIALVPALFPPAVLDNPAWQTRYDVARQMGHQTGKPLAVFIGSGKAGWDQLLVDGPIGKETLRLLATDYVCLYVDAGAAEGKQLATAFAVSSAPGLVISDSSGDVQAFRHEGRLADEALIRHLRKYSDRQRLVEATELSGLAQASRVEEIAPAAAPPSAAAEIVEQEVQWRYDYEAARREAREKNRPIILHFGTTTCFWCKRLESITFRDRGIIRQLNSLLIPVKIDAEQAPALTQEMRVQVYPTLVFIAPDGRVLASRQGFVDVAALGQQLADMGIVLAANHTVTPSSE